MSATRYFTAADYYPSALLRRTKDADEAFVGGTWRPTMNVIEWLAGENDFVDEVTEEQARDVYPEAFK